MAPPAPRRPRPQPRPRHRQGGARRSSRPACRRRTSSGRSRCSARATAIGWGVGLTILTALGNLLPVLPEEETYLALFHGARRVAADCDGQAPRRERAPLASRPDLRDPQALAAALDRGTPPGGGRAHRAHRHRGGASPAALADLLLAAETDRAFADGGHSLDFINKAFECLDLIGWEHAAERAADRGRPDGGRTRRRGMDRLALTRSISSPCARNARRSCRACSPPARGRAALVGSCGARRTASSATIRPRSSARSKAAVRAGASPADLGRSLAYAAALRVARFGSANEHSDWETAHHVFTYANAVHQMLKRMARTADAGRPLRGRARPSCTAAMALYLARYLNVPPARLPGEGGDQRWTICPTDAEALRAALLDAFDRQRQVDAGGTSRRTPSHARSPAAGADRDARRGRCCARTRASTPTRCWRPACASSASGADTDAGPAHPHRRRPLSRRPFTHRARRACRPPTSRAA